METAQGQEAAGIQIRRGIHVCGPLLALNIIVKSANRLESSSQSGTVFWDVVYMATPSGQEAAGIQIKRVIHVCDPLLAPNIMVQFANRSDSSSQSSTVF